MGLKQITAPAIEPITLADIKTRVNMDEDITEKDADIELLLIPAARAQAESRTGRAMMTQTLQLTLFCFPYGAISLPKPQLQSVDWIKYLDVDGVQQTLATSDYLVINDELYGYVVPAYGKSWPVASQFYYHPIYSWLWRRARAGSRRFAALDDDGSGNLVE